MSHLEFHVRPNGLCPYDDYVNSVFQSGKKQEAAKVRATLDRLAQSGSDGLVKMRLAEKMNDVWQLRIGVHRVFYFWHGNARQFVILNGFRKQTRKTPSAELHRAEALRVEHLDAGGSQ